MSRFAGVTLSLSKRQAEQESAGEIPNHKVRDLKKGQSSARLTYISAEADLKKNSE